MEEYGAQIEQLKLANKDLKETNRGLYARLETSEQDKLIIEEKLRHL
jgi:hypothetical protein